jgi:ABC-type antimicrobial peptide transport system permease subunit
VLFFERLKLLLPLETCPILYGLVAGLMAAAFRGRLIRALLFGVSPVDGRTMVLATLLLGAAGVLACVLPGRSVSRADPARILRYE